MSGAAWFGATLVFLALLARSRHRTRRYTCLSLLSVRNAYGLDLVIESRGILKRGTVYVVLDGLIGDGLVEVAALHPYPNSDRTRRLFRLTTEGRAALGQARPVDVGADGKRRGRGQR